MKESEDFTIQGLEAYEILDSRGNPTLRVCVRTVTSRACADVPAGASKGKNEAIEMRDGVGKLGGLGVRKAVNLIKENLSQVLVGEDVRDQLTIDNLLISLDGTGNKNKLGGNTILGISLAVARLAAFSLGIPLYTYLGGPTSNSIPVPFLNILNGGKHAGNQMSFQEFMIVPHGFTKFSEAIWASSEVYHALKKLIKDKYGSVYTGIGDEGGFAPPIKDPEVALKLISDSISFAGYKLESDFYLAIDAAASNFFIENKNVYVVNDKDYTREKLIEYYEHLVEQFPIKSLEDPLHEEDFEGFAILTNEMKKRNVLIVGDDLLTTNVKRLEIALKTNAVSAVLVKPNQIGTLSETVAFVKKAKSRSLKTIISHRSGDTEDNFISDLAVALDVDAIKSGAPCRGERTSKYNRLIEIEEELGANAIYNASLIFKAESSAQ